MKLFQLLVKTVVAPVLLLTSASAQTKSDIKSLVDGKNFVFSAQTVLPSTGSVRQLTSGYYTLRFSKDTLVADLPYFGRAYSAPIDPTQGGLKFTSKDFDYAVKEKKKEWDITIKPHDAGDASQIYLTVYDNGTAYLQVVSINRQPITFNGVIEAKK